MNSREQSNCEDHSLSYKLEQYGHDRVKIQAKSHKLDYTNQDFAILHDLVVFSLADKVLDLLHQWAGTRGAH